MRGRLFAVQQGASRMSNITAYQVNRAGATPIKTIRFSGGEVQVTVTLKHADDVHMLAHLRSSDDIMELLMVTDAMRRQHPAIKIFLTMPYLPYARQDRVCAPGEALSLCVMCDLINAQKYESVTVMDPHSDVSTALLHRCVAVSQAEILGEVRGLASFGRYTVVAPDAGALKKVAAVAKALGTTYVRADKSRDPATGAITGTMLIGDVAPDADLLIVDDICDGGRTFIELAKVLREHTTGRIDLYVTHGIFSKGHGVFDGLIGNVFVANPFASLPVREAKGETQFVQV